MRRCACAEKIVLLTSWTNENLGRRFWKCSSQIQMDFDIISSGMTHQLSIVRNK
ncbi:hypothetical protein LINPERPRIM_LOCUS369 [Linum perenne]